MPYYCTVPRCTSMAGKAKNVSFHQFPRDEELAKLWNEILKRGKPYTKYSKVCSLHFKPEDYTITGLGRNKGQWRTLRKDAVPSQNLPSDSPTPCHRSRNRGSRIINVPTGMMDSQLQQVAQAIYTQTMLAIQASGAGDLSMASIYNEQEASPNREDSTSRSSNSSGQFNETLSQIEHLLHKNNISTELTQDSMLKYNNNESVNTFSQEPNMKSKTQDFIFKHTYKCTDCSKCFKDPDVFILHKRTHMPKNPSTDMDVLRKTLSENVCSEKENFDNNTSKNCIGENSKEETLRANPILANLLKSNMPQTLHKDEMQEVLDYKNVTSIENQIMAALASNMKNYFMNWSSMMTQTAMLASQNISDVLDDSISKHKDNYTEAGTNADECNNATKGEAHGVHQHMQLEEVTNDLKHHNTQQKFGSNCDSKESKDLDESMDSSSLVIEDDTQICDLVCE